jgi:hypothetical protein
MVGNENDANLALAGRLELLGAGCTRKVYIDDAHEVVYKVEHFEQEVSHTSNYDEYALSDIVLPEPLIIPAMTLYDNGVLAMEYVSGGYMSGECYCTQDEECDDTCMPESLLSILRTISPDCGTWGNSIWKDGKLYLIDLGH